MPLPAPKIGLVVRYGFVWAGGARRSPPDAGKDRPCLIIDVEEVAAAGRTSLRVAYLPFSHVAPREGEEAISLPPRVAAHLGLSAERSWLYLSYAVEDDWPFDLARVPGSPDRYDHGFVPPRLVEVVAEAFRARLKRRPSPLHRRDG